jgi:hypothetical protein
MKYMQYRICEDNSICVHTRRDAEPGESEDSKQDIWSIVIPGQDVSTQPKEVQDVAAQLWTSEVISNFKTRYNLN